MLNKLVRNSTAAVCFAFAAFGAQAAPININLDGTIISPTDGPFTNGAAVQANLWFDLDAANALSSEVVNDNGILLKRYLLGYWHEQRFTV